MVKQNLGENKVHYGLGENGEWLSCVLLNLVSQTFAN